MNLLLIALLSALTLAPIDAPPVSAAETTAVTVVVTKLPSATATRKLYFYNVKANSLLRNHYTTLHYTLLKDLKPGSSAKVVCSIQLPPGEWAIAATQDLNENDLVTAT